MTAISSSTSIDLGSSPPKLSCSPPRKSSPRKTPTKKTFTEAIKEKYSLEDEGTSGNGYVIMRISGRPRKTSEAEAELEHLRNVVLSRQNISQAGIPTDGLKQLCPNVSDLDLTANLLDSWDEVLLLLKELPRLSFLNLAENSLHSKEALDTWAVEFPSLKNLVLNRTQTNWDDISKIAKYVPSLRELHLCGNGFSKVNSEGLDCLKQLECLRLNGNRLQSWEEIWKLHELPNLKTLILSENPLSEVYYRTCDVIPTTDDVTSKADDVTSKADDVTSNTDDVKSPPADSEDSDVCKTSDPVESNSGSEPRERDDVRGCEPTERDDVRGCEPADTQTTENPRQVCSQMVELIFDSAVDGVGSSADQRTEQSSEKPTAVRCACDGEPFKSLDTLCLTETQIDSWHIVPKLNNFPALNSVKILKVPLGDELDAEERRKMVVASLPRMSKVNGSEVTSEERLKAERHYVRYWLDKDNKPPHFTDLSTKHGDVKPLVDIDISFGLKEYVTVRLVHKGKDIGEKTLKTTATVCELYKELIQQLEPDPPKSFIGTPMYQSNLRLFIQHKTRDPNDPTTAMPEEMVSSSLPISRFDFCDGDDLLIDEGPPVCHLLQTKFKKVYD